MSVSHEEIAFCIKGQSDRVDQALTAISENGRDASPRVARDRVVIVIGDVKIPGLIEGEPVRAAQSCRREGRNRAVNRGDFLDRIAGCAVVTHDKKITRGVEGKSGRPANFADQTNESSVSGKDLDVILAKGGFVKGTADRSERVELGCTPATNVRPTGDGLAEERGAYREQEQQEGRSQQQLPGPGRKTDVV